VLGLSLGEATSEGTSPFLIGWYPSKKSPKFVISFIITVCLFNHVIY
jgi:hypothetical protein